MSDLFDVKSSGNVTELTKSTAARGTEGNAGSQQVQDEAGNVLPTEEELKTLKRVVVPLPYTAYLLCIVEFAERGSYFGCKQVFANFVNNPLPVGGNGSVWSNPCKTKSTYTILSFAGPAHHPKVPSRTLEPWARALSSHLQLWHRLHFWGMDCHCSPAGLQMRDSVALGRSAPALLSCCLLI